MYRRAVSSLARGALRTARPAPRPAAAPAAAALRAACTSPTAPLSCTRSFTSSTSRLSHGENDAALSAKLASELEYERNEGSDNAATSVESAGQSEPEFLTAFKASGIWSIEDKSGADEVALTRRFGNEHIKVLFSIADIDNSPENENDPEHEEGEEAAAAEPAEESEEDDSSSESLPIRTAITISKGAGQGAMTIDAVAQDGVFLVDNISLYKDEKLATDLTSEADWSRRGLYMGPAFDHLDEALQTDFENFLEERGIDSNLALFIPDLAEYKEQKEYVQWLENVKLFIDA